MVVDFDFGLESKMRWYQMYIFFLRWQILKNLNLCHPFVLNFSREGARGLKGLSGCREEMEGQFSCLNIGICFHLKCHSVAPGLQLLLLKKAVVLL